MAVINKDLALMSFNNTFSRLSARPLDSTSIYYTLSEAQTYAQTDPYAYVGQIISVVDESNETATAYIIVDTAGDLEEIGTGGSSTIVVQNLSDLTSTVAEDLEVGQTAFVVSESKSYILTAIGDTPPSTYQWTEMTSSDTVWSGTENSVVFYALTQSQYDGIGSKDTNTLYFITDSGSVYKGSQDVTKFVVPTTSIPAAASDAVIDKLYIDTATYEAKVTTDGTNWINLTPGYITDGGNWAETTNDAKLGTIGVIKQVITQALATISTNVAFDAGTGTVTVGTGTGAVLTGVAHGVTYDAGQLLLTIPVYGSENIVVNIPRDTFVQSGSYDAEEQEIVLVTNTGTEIRIPAADLVDVYTADNAGRNVQVTVTADNKISASITIDPEAGNALSYSDSGFMVDISGKIDVISSATGNKVALTTASGGVSESTFDVVSSGEMGELNTTIPTANLIAAAIASAVNTINSSLSGKLDKLTGSASDAGKIAVVGADGTTITIGSVKLSDLATTAQLANKVDKVSGTENDIVVFGADGAIADSDKTIGGTTLSSDTTGNIVATEAAVNGALSWKQLS